MERRIEDLEAFGQRIRERRKNLGFSQEKFALHTGIDRSYMGAIERGQRNLTFWLLCDLAVALDCDLGTLMKGFPTDRSGSEVK
jgi:transcriptional regulator with XRE-family HTH domain